MTLEFDLENIDIVEFGVGLESDNGQIAYLVPVDINVQKALEEMTLCTWAEMQKRVNNLRIYEPSEKYESIEYVYIPLDSELASTMRTLHEAQNIQIKSNALEETDKMYFYFARLIDSNHRRLTAVRRATFFKGILKNRVIRLATDALVIVKDKLFKLDNDFDLIIDSANVHILRPSGFEFIGKLKKAVLAAVTKNISVLQQNLPFLDLTNIQEYASSHPRAARYLSAIRSRQDLEQINREALKSYCIQTGVEITENNGKIMVCRGHEMGFLEVLDRRRFECELIKGSPERYKAESRRKILK